MNYQKVEIKEGINLHVIKANQFKTNLLSVFITLPLTRENVTKEALISAVLRRGSNKYPTSEALSIALEEMYGASFDCGIEKIGDNHILKFYLETINEEFLPNQEEVLKKGLEVLFDIVFNPLCENGAFKEEYVVMEKENLKQIIESKIDNKDRYALNRCIEEMYQDKPYGLYKYGYVEDLERISAKELYNIYKDILQKAKIDIFVSGNVDTNKIEDIVCSSEKMKEQKERKTDITKSEEIEEVDEPKQITENMDVTQGKLVIRIKSKRRK